MFVIATFRAVVESVGQEEWVFHSCIPNVIQVIGMETGDKS